MIPVIEESRQFMRERDEARAEVARLREAIEHFIAALDDGTQISAAVALLELRAALEVEK